MAALWIETLLNIIIQICTAETAAGIGLVVMSLDFRFIITSLFKGSRFESEPSLVDEAEILQKKQLIL